MKKMLCMVVGLLVYCFTAEKSFSFDEIALSDVNTITVGHIDLYAGADDGTGTLRSVALYRS